MTELTREQIDFFNENGYLLIPNFFDVAKVDAIKGRMREIISKIDTSTKTVFTTGENQAKLCDDYFLESGDKIRMFWEEDAWKVEREEVDGVITETKTLVNSVEQSINKVGHALHDLDDFYGNMFYDPKLGRIARDCGLHAPLAVQTMYIFKQPRIGGAVNPHQDGSYLITNPQSCMGFWWALDNCTVDNGCLWAVPGSHKQGVKQLYQRTTSPDAKTKMEYIPVENPEFDKTGAIPVVVEKGTLLLIHGALVHYSGKNTSDQQRNAITLHIVDGKEGIEYSPLNWLQRPPDMPFKVIPSE